MSDVFCVACQEFFPLAQYTREFRGSLFIEGKCPTCSGEVVKPVSTR